ncbi:c-type cytochrome [Membranihabitans maritimus]|uniref:c-type cytochrome n=1 Tax=Membranihabitans maritimus TaxID=2904244 RepID=UPI001F01226A|nr:cytochrome c [Membranihabitans maritimus]
MKKTLRLLLLIKNFIPPKKRVLWLAIPVFCILINCSHPYQQGERLYAVNCERCHGNDGEGFENLYPSLVKSGFIQNYSPSLACVISHGSHYLQSRQDKNSTGGMPENPHLSAIEVLNIVNFLHHKFETGFTEKLTTVESSLKNCEH